MRYIIGFILLIVLVIFSFTFIFRGHSNKPVIRPLNLLDYANTSTVVQFTEDGPVNADSLHQAVRITIGRDGNSVNVIQGYQGTVATNNTYPNNEQAYNVFLHALILEGFMTKATTKITDNTGVCPFGERYNLEITDSSGHDIQSLWTASCVSGTFGGNLQKVGDLFKAQIPDYSTVVQNVNL